MCEYPSPQFPPPTSLPPPSLESQAPIPTGTRPHCRVACPHTRAGSMVSHCPLAYQLGWGGPRGALPLSGKPSIEVRSTGSCLLPWELHAALIWEGTPESRGGHTLSWGV